MAPVPVKIDGISVHRFKQTLLVTNNSGSIVYVGTFGSRRFKSQEPLRAASIALLPGDQLTLEPISLVQVRIGLGR